MAPWFKASTYQVVNYSNSIWAKHLDWIFFSNLWRARRINRPESDGDRTVAERPTVIRIEQQTATWQDDREKGGAATTRRTGGRKVGLWPIGVRLFKPSAGMWLGPHQQARAHLIL